MEKYWNETFLARNNIGWSFPSTNGGEEEGFNNGCLTLSSGPATLDIEVYPIIAKVTSKKAGTILVPDRILINAAPRAYIDIKEALISLKKKMIKVKRG